MEVPRTPQAGLGAVCPALPRGPLWDPTLLAPKLLSVLAPEGPFSKTNLISYLG